MNERIRELAEQAVKQVSDDLRKEDEAKWYSDLPMDQSKFEEKFAELIVKECVSIVAKRKDQAIDDGWNVDEAMTMAEMDLEEHFGVEL